MSHYNLEKTVVLVGMMGAGKTAVGNALAKKIGAPFIDSDTQIEEAANQTIAEIFESSGEPFFRDKEALVLARLLNGEPCILSTGGGAFLQEGNREMIKKKGLAVWLSVDLELLWSRVRHKDTRPLLQIADPKAKLQELFDQRQPYYSQASLIVDADPNYSVQDMADKVVDSLMDHPSRILNKVD